MNGISLLHTRGTTNTAGALSEMHNNMFTARNGDSSGRPNVGIIITDGRSNDRDDTVEQARQVSILILLFKLLF